jgi:hypothetical protein
VVAVCADPLGRGAGEPSVGISPAKAKDEIATVRISVIKNRLMEILL